MIRDLLFLWETRHSSGFPRPFEWGLSPPTRRLLFQQWATGHIWHTVVPLRRQVLGIPLRPYRWFRMVREIARVRRMPYAPSMQDDVP